MYIIKKHYEATESNPNFAGEVKDFYEGKAGRLIGSNSFPTKGEIDAYGYGSLAAAKKGLARANEYAEWENKMGHWNVSVELIEVSED